MRRFRRVAVLMGGPSDEREVSLRSGRAVAQALRTAGYEVAEVVVDDGLPTLPAQTEAVFIALHGRFGEDGQVQCWLQQRGMPYTGSGPESSSASFDKRISKRIFESAKIPTPAWAVARAGDPCPLPLPVVVKPPRQGSSIGARKVAMESEWAAALEAALRYEEEALVEAFIPGRELTVGMLDGQPLPVIEIHARGGWYGYEEKYTPGLTRYDVPARLSATVTKRAQALAVETYRALGCRGMGRVDFRMTPEGDLFVLEMNTVPGFTETSLLPKAAGAAGLSFSDLCARILEKAAL